MSGGRRLNIPLIKSVVMAVVGFAIAGGSAVVGIGAQVAAAPAIAFLLGYSPDVTAGTAIAFALFASASSVVGGHLGGTDVPFALALLLAVCATGGVIFAARFADDERLKGARRLAHLLVMLLGIFIINQTMSPRLGGPQPVGDELLRSPVGVALVGALAGVASQTFQIPTGVLLVPALIYLCGRTPAEAILASLFVVALASLLPAIASANRGLVDRRIGPWMTLGGIAGGLAGGWILVRTLGAGSPWPLIAFSLVAMYLSAVWFWRLR